MSRRMTKKEILFWFWVVIIGLPLYGIHKLGDMIGWAWFAGGLVIVCILSFWVYTIKGKAKAAERVKQEKELSTEAIHLQSERVRLEIERRAELQKKYGDTEIVEAILSHSYWQGQTSAQLHDSLGPPEDVNVKVLKTKKKEVWKYYHMGANRFGLRIILEQDEVIGWDEKT